MQSLVRSRVGIFRVEDALTLAQLQKLQDEGKIASVIVKPDAVFADKRAVTVTQAGHKLLANGNCLSSGYLSVPPEFADKEQVRVYGSDTKFYGLYAYYSDERMLRPVKMFPEREE